MKFAHTSNGGGGGGGGGQPPKGYPKREPDDADDSTIAGTMRLLIRQVLQAIANLMPTAGAANPTPTAGPAPGGPPSGGPAPGGAAAAPEPPLEPNSNHGTRWYAVTVGLDVGVFNDWHYVSSVTQGVPNSCYRRYSSRAAAERAYRTAWRENKVHVVDGDGNHIN